MEKKPVVSVNTELQNSLTTKNIAIIGMSCRFPGGADTPESFWKLLENEVDAIGSLPKDRWNSTVYDNASKEFKSLLEKQQGGYLKNIDLFDPGFFRISPVEAESIDPQIRLLLELSYESLINSGQDLEKLKGSQTGVFIGISNHDYEERTYRSGNLDAITPYSLTGASSFSASGRISYTFGLEGPSLSIDTASSSSLVAVHYACKSLLLGESDLTLAGGVNLILTPEHYIPYAKLNALSSDSCSKAFDIDGNGFVPSEGGGLVALKRYSEAVADGDPILGIIRGSAVNQDGASNGFTAPNMLSQEKLIRKALKDADLQPDEIGYIETHGTGTPLGDETELKSMGEVFEEQKENTSPFLIGSVKTNIGHLEAAAGIAGFIKTVLCLQKKMIPANLHFNTPNPKVDWQKSGFRVPVKLTEWNPKQKPRIAGVNSFGISGTNAHVILEEAPVQETKEEFVIHQKDNYLLPVTAKNEEALMAYTKLYQEVIEEQIANYTIDKTIYNICYSASLKCSHLERRTTFSFSEPEELLQQLKAFSTGGQCDGISNTKKDVISKKKTVFVFSGQGSQQIAMGKELIEKEEVFRKKIEACEKAFAPYVDWSLTEEIKKQGEESRLKVSTAIFQPALFSIQIALAALWESYGIKPEAVIGHSLGEISAYHIAGTLSLEDAALIICKRSQLMAQLEGKGKVAVIGLPMKDVRDKLKSFEDEISLAGSNSSTSTVISGNPDAVTRFYEEIKQSGLFCRYVSTGGVAVHSFQLDPFLEKFEETIKKVKHGKAAIPIYSTVDNCVTYGEDADASYWVRNLRNPVLFSSAIELLMHDQYNIFIELSPHPVLKFFIDSIAAENKII